MASSAPLVTFAFGTPFERLHALCNAVPNPPTQLRFDVVDSCTPRVASLMRGRTPSQGPPGVGGAPWSLDVVAPDSATPVVQSPLEFSTSGFAAVEVRLLDFWQGGVRTEMFEFDAAASTRQLYDAVELWLGRDMNVVLFALDPVTGGVSHVVVPGDNRILSTIPSPRLPLLGHYCPVPASEVPPSCWTAVHVFTFSSPECWDSVEVELVVPPLVVPCGIDTHSDEAVSAAAHAAASVVCSSELSRRLFTQLAASAEAKIEPDSESFGICGRPPAVFIGYPRIQPGDVVGITLPTEVNPRGVSIREVCPALPSEGIACRTLIVEDLLSGEIIGPCLFTCLCDFEDPDGE